MNKREFSFGFLAGLITFLGASVAVKAASHDVAWTFGNVGSFSYRLDAFSPADAGLVANIGRENPTLTLHIGQRYQVTIINYTVHPFQVIAKGASAGADIPLLSMGVTTSPFE